MSGNWAAYASDLVRALATIDPQAVDKAAQILVAAHGAGRRVFLCGNGGSAAIANHMQYDHSRDIFPARVLSLSANPVVITAIANDMAFEEVFSYQLRHQAALGDVLVAVSSSGMSPNIIQVLKWADGTGLRTIALTGFSGGEASSLAEVSIHVASTNYGVIEDSHQAVLHSIAQRIRRS